MKVTLDTDSIELALRMMWPGELARMLVARGLSPDEYWRRAEREFLGMWTLFSISPGCDDVAALCYWLKDSARACGEASSGVPS